MINIKKILAEHIEWLKGLSKGKRADLKNADLTGANLMDANLKNADLTGADLTGADLRGTKFLSAIHKTDLSILKQQKSPLIAFKYLDGQLSPYQNAIYKIGATYSVNVYNSDERILCAEGINVATLDWCLRDTNCDLSKTYIEVEFNPEDIIAIPYNSDGKFRVRKLKVVRELTQRELENYTQPLYPSVEGKQEK